MQVKDIYQEVCEVTGSCSSDVNLRAITRAVELLANKGLFDPLLGTLDFTVDGGYWIALPRDVKTPLRININNNPSFSRNRLFEFAPNAEGSVDGAEIGWQWHERGYSPIQDDKKLPSRLYYIVTSDDDIGKTLTVRGIDVDGYERKEVLVSALSGSAVTEFVYGEVRSVTRDATATEAWLYSETGVIGRYYPDEENPEYRVIKLSQTAVAVRMLYRKHVFKLTAQTDIIPLHSAMAVIRAVDAVRLMQRKQYADATLVLEEAVRIIGEEQESRDDGTSIAGAAEIATATNTNITTNDVLIVADVYDMASDILGPVGRPKLFDRLTDAINALSNKAHWDSLLGEAILTRMANLGEPATARCRGNGYFALPRYVGAVLAANFNGGPAIPRNGWFEYHLNGTGQTKFASCGTWDDVGETCIINGLPNFGNRSETFNVLAIPNSSLDDGKKVTVFGIERLLNGREIEVWRDGKAGWDCPCQSTGFTLPLDAPDFVRIDRITREATADFVRFVGFTERRETIALVGDCGEDNSHAAAVASLIAAQTLDDTILLGDVNYEEAATVFIPAGLYAGSNGPVVGLNITIRHYVDGAEIGDGLVIRINGVERTIISTIDIFSDSGDFDFQGIYELDEPIVASLNDVVQAYGDGFTDWSATVEAKLTANYGALKTAGKLDAVPGNHEWGDPDLQEGRHQAFLDYFGYTFVDEFGNPAANFVKSFADVDVFFLDSDSRNPLGVTIGGDQHSWLQSAVAASTAKWKVVVLHHPPYSSGDHHGATTALRWDFAAMGVHAVIAGHEHSYERYEKDGVLYFIVGTGGKSLYGFIGSPSSESKKRLQEYGALFMEATPRSLKFKFLNTSAAIRDERGLSSNSTLIDETLLGYWYPDELEPRYRMIKAPGCCASPIRIRYRKRTKKITSLYDVINLRSRLAVENMLRALAAQATDPAAAVSYEQLAVSYLEQEQTATNPHGGGWLQFDPANSPGFNENIQ